MKRTLSTATEQDLVKSGLWKSNIYQDCLVQQLFLAIRNDQIGLYHKGGLLFKFEKNDYQTS